MAGDQSGGGSANRRNHPVSFSRRSYLDRFGMNRSLLGNPLIGAEEQFRRLWHSADFQDFDPLLVQRMGG